MIPEDIRSCIEDRLAYTVQSAKRVPGGSINQAARVEVKNIGSCFLKWNRSADPDMFRKEVKGLNVLSGADTSLRIPEVILQGTTPQGTGYLLQEFIEQSQPADGAASEFGRQLANLHTVRSDRFGLDHNNYIGRLPQPNSWHTNWEDFFIQERIEPQLERALHSGKFSSGISRSFQKMYNRLADIFPDESPGLLHGDLWGGNYFFDAEGKATIYDPAVYYGHREIELAFTHLFGGFSPEFYQAYEEALPLEPDFQARKDIYNLYPLLVHTNLFGGSYARQVESIVQRFE